MRGWKIEGRVATSKTGWVLTYSEAGELVRIAPPAGADFSSFIAVSAEAGKIGERIKRQRRDRLEGGKRRQIYLDDATVEKAGRIGHGNASAGIRRAVAEFAEKS